VPKKVSQIWVAPDRIAGRSVVDRVDVVPFDGVPIDEKASRRKWDSPCGRPSGCAYGNGAGRYTDPSLYRHYDAEFGPGKAETVDLTGLLYRDLSTLPTDPDVLRERIETTGLRQLLFGEVHLGGNAVETFDIVGQLLSTPGNYAPPALRQALYEVVAGLPDVELVGEVTDPVGRRGIAVALDNNGIKRELIFDPRTAALLARRDVVSDSPAKVFTRDYPRDDLHLEPGTPISYTAYLVSGVADSTHQTPAASVLQGARLPAG
jgi:hypothetical protein